MSQQTVRSGVGRTTTDYIKLAAYTLYGLATVSFLIGLYFDWSRPGEAIIPVLSIARDPANSGFFVLAIILLLIGFIASKIASMIQERRTENVDQTQEWTVDVGNDSS